jgi:endoglucanase
VVTPVRGFGAIALLALALLVAVGCSSSASRPADRPIATPLRGLRVLGNRLVDRAGQPVTLQGVNRSGTENACIRGFGIFFGPSDAASVRAIASWHVNFVRVLINEDCWLGINGVEPALGGRSYRRALVGYVALLNRLGMYAEVSLIWAAPGHYQATYQPAAPDADHAPAVWASMASTFRKDPNVILAPWGETLVDSRCLLRGGCEATYGHNHTPYRVAGMQQAVDVMRAAGYRGVISIPGTHYSNDLTGWLAHEPRDPLHELIAEAHVYGNDACSSVSCLNRTMAPVAQRVPLILGEFGETHEGSSCGYANTSRILHWATAHRVGYAAWQWATWPTCFALITSYDGRPAHAYGRFVKSWYLSH